MLPTRRSAFTLIDLLVVLAVIAVCAAIVLPTLATTRERAQQQSCLSNVKQIGAAGRLYSMDNNAFVPPADTDTGTWYSELAPYLGLPVAGNFYYDYSAQISVLTCPADQWTNFSLGRVDYISYAVNGFVAGDYTFTGPNGGFSEPSLRQDQIANQNQVIFAGDTDKMYASGWGIGLTPTDWVRAANLNGQDYNTAMVPGCARLGAFYSDPCVLWLKDWMRDDHNGTFDVSSSTPCTKRNGTAYANGWACKAPDFRHSRTGAYTGNANFVYLDGHTATVAFKNQTTWS